MTEEFIEIHVTAPLEVCERRDPKGLYAKSRPGQLPNFTGNQFTLRGARKSRSRPRHDLGTRSRTGAARRGAAPGTRSCRDTDVEMRLAGSL